MDKKAVRVAYGEALVKLGEENEKVVVLDADLAGATMTNGFKKAYPDRFYQNNQPLFPLLFPKKYWTKSMQTKNMT